MVDKVTIAVALAGLIALISSNAHADVEARIQEAKVAYHRGFQELRAGRYRRALAHYERSYRLHPRPRTLFNIAVCEDELGLDEAAWRRYRAFVAQAEPRDTEYVGRARSRIEALAKRLTSRVKGESTPAGAVASDGEATRKKDRVGSAPKTDHVTVRRPGAERHQTSARPSRRQSRRTRVRLRRRVMTGAIVVRAGAGARATIDGAPVTPPGGRVAIAVGMHRVRVTRVGHHDWQRAVHVSPGEQVRLDVRLQPRASAGRRWLGWGSVVAGAGAFAGAGVLGVLAIRDVTSVDSAVHARGKRRALVADVAAAAGVVALSIAWKLLQKKRSKGAVWRSYQGGRR